MNIIANQISMNVGSIVDLDIGAGGNTSVHGDIFIDGDLAIGSNTAVNDYVVVDGHLGFGLDSAVHYRILAQCDLPPNVNTAVDHYISARAQTAPGRDRAHRRSLGKVDVAAGLHGTGNGRLVEYIDETSVDVTVNRAALAQPQRAH